MGNIEKIVLSWTGLPGGTGNTVLFWKASNALNMQPATKNLVLTWLPYICPSISVTVPNNGEVLDEATGKMNGVWSSGTAATTPGTSTSTAYTPNAGALITWNTIAFANGRKVRGRTFVVPLAVSNYTTSGGVTPTCQAALQSGANSYITNGGNVAVVWSRPIYTKPPGSTLTRPGLSYYASSATVPLKVATLKGRRDT